MVGRGELTTFRIVALVIEVLPAFFTGSLMAAGKLQDSARRPITYRNQNLVNLALFVAAGVCGTWLAIDPTQMVLFPVMIGLSLTFMLLILPDGGADMLI